MLAQCFYRGGRAQLQIVIEFSRSMSGIDRSSALHVFAERADLIVRKTSNVRQNERLVAAETLWGEIMLGHEIFEWHMHIEQHLTKPIVCMAISRDIVKL